MLKEISKLTLCVFFAWVSTAFIFHEDLINDMVHIPSFFQVIFNPLLLRSVTGCVIVWKCPYWSSWFSAPVFPADQRFWVYVSHSGLSLLAIWKHVVLVHLVLLLSVSVCQGVPTMWVWPYHVVVVHGRPYNFPKINRATLRDSEGMVVFL